jgi:hypothetical protein
MTLWKKMAIYKPRKRGDSGETTGLTSSFWISSLTNHEKLNLPHLSCPVYLICDVD